MDIMTADMRSRHMSRIRGRNTKPELLVRRYLHARGLRYRLHDTALPGSPDLIFRSRNAVVFVHGCFWHGHRDCRCFRLPATRTDFWKSKIAANCKRDAQAVEALFTSGWRVGIVWTCSLRGKGANSALASLESFISSTEVSCEIRSNPTPGLSDGSSLRIGQDVRKRSVSAS